MTLRGRIVLSAVLLFALLSLFMDFPFGLPKKEADLLCASIEEDPCYADGVYYIYNLNDYLRFSGYMNRARKEDPEDDTATAVDASLMADLNLEEDERCRNISKNPYIKICILNYRGTFEGNGHTITWKDQAGNGMFACLEREAVVCNLNFRASSLVWEMDEYGVGMLCMINYGTIRSCTTEGRIEGTACYVGGIAGINRGVIEDCENRAEVVVHSLGEYGAGGIAGLNKCEVLEGESEEAPVVPEIRSCVNYGTIEGTWEAGGICAYNDCANIRDCGNEGAVTVQYQRGYIYPDYPDSYERSRAGGICGRMGWNNLENCYNKGEVSVLEEGTEDGYAIAGDTLFWINTVSGCVSLKGTTGGSIRHESVMELEPKDLDLWMEDHDSIPYVHNSWEFDLEEAKEKLPLIPLGIAESPLTSGREDVYLCEEFCLRTLPGFSVCRVSPYALCVEQTDFDGISDTGDGALQIWLLRISEDLADIKADVSGSGTVTTKDIAHELWIGIEGSHWLHPSWSYKDDTHVKTVISSQGTGQKTWIIHYRDDFLARAAVDTEYGMIDNVAALPLQSSEEGKYGAKWLVLFTNKKNDYRPSPVTAEKWLESFTWLPCGYTVKKGDCLYAIARRYTGDGNRYPELAVCNEITERELLIPGQRLKLPDEWLIGKSTVF